MGIVGLTEQYVLGKAPRDRGTFPSHLGQKSDLRDVRVEGGLVWDGVGNDSVEKILLI